MNVSLFKSHLSENLRRVQAGETLVVTDRRKPIARIVPYDQDHLLEREAEDAFRPVRPLLVEYQFIVSQELLVAERGDRRKCIWIPA